MIKINDIKGSGTITCIYWTNDFDNNSKTGAVLGRGWRDDVDVVMIERGCFYLLAPVSAVRDELACFTRDNYGGFLALESAVIRAAFASDPPTLELLSRIVYEIKAMVAEGERVGGLHAQREIRRSIGFDD